MFASYFTVVCYIQCICPVYFNRYSYTDKELKGSAYFIFNNCLVMCNLEKNACSFMPTLHNAYADPLFNHTSILINTL